MKAPRLISNPPWVDEVVENNLRTLTRGPRGAEVIYSGGAGEHIHAPELGCGAYGCVLRTTEDRMVLKITTDASEATFVRMLQDRGVEKTAGLTQYYGTDHLQGKHNGRSIFALWREEADDVGRLEAMDLPNRIETFREAIHFAFRLRQFRWLASIVMYTFENAKDRERTKARAAELAGWAAPQLEPQHIDMMTRQAAKEESTVLDEHQGPHKIALALRACRIVADFMTTESPASGLVGETFNQLMDAGLLLADVHGGNVGRVIREDRYGEWPVWVVTDPGHMVLLR